MTQWAPGHTIGIWMRVGDGPEQLIGTASESVELPLLFHAIANQWELGPGPAVYDDDDGC